MVNKTLNTKNDKLKTPIVVFAVVFAIIFFVVIVVSVVLDGSDNSNRNSNKIYNMNEVATNSEGVQFTVLGVENTQQLGSSTFGDTTEYNFAIVTIKVYNGSSKEISLSGSCAELYRSSTNTKYEYFSTLYIDDIVISEDIGVGLSRTFEVAFEIPTKTTNENYVISIGYNRYTSNSKRVKILLKDKNADSNSGSSTDNGGTSSGGTENENTGITNYEHLKGETFTFYGLEFTITGSRLGFCSPGNSNNETIAITMKIKNPTSKSIDPDILSFVLVYDDEYKYLPGWSYSYDYIQTYSSIDPLEELSPVYVEFEIPESIYSLKNKMKLRISTAYTNADEFHYVTIV